MAEIRPPTPLTRFKGSPRFWDDPEVETSMLGPLPIPWEMRKFYFNPTSGAFRRAIQRWHLKRKNPEVIDQGLAEKSFVSAPDGSATHLNGSPVILFSDLVSIFDKAEEDRSSLGETFLLLAKNRPDWRLTNHFVTAVEEGPKVYPAAVADFFNEVYGLGPVNPLRELQLLEGENSTLKARKRSTELAEENSSLREEMLEQHRLVSEGLLTPNSEESSPLPEEAVATHPRVRTRKRIGN